MRDACIFIPWEDPGFIVWNPVLPVLSPEDRERMQKLLEGIWPPKVRMRSSYFWKDPESGLNCLVQVSSDGKRYGVAYQLRGDPYLGECPLPKLRMKKRVETFERKHPWLPRKAPIERRIGMESLRAFIVAMREAIIGLS